MIKIDGTVSAKKILSGDVSTNSNTSGVVEKPASIPQYIFELEFKTRDNFPIIGDENMLYVSTDENICYRWDADTAKYIPLTPQDISYNDLLDIPTLNGIPIEGDKENEDYGIDAISNFELADLLK